jgi:hypothetical protein
MGGMSISNPLADAIEQVGLVALARALSLTHQAIRKWERAGRLPRTEWTGETNYAEQIERLTGGRVTKAMLLGGTRAEATARTGAASGAQHGADDLTPLAMGVDQRAAARGDSEPERFASSSAPVDDGTPSALLAAEASLASGGVVKRLRAPRPRTERSDQAATHKAPAPTAGAGEAMPRTERRSGVTSIAFGVESRHKPPRLDADDRIQICVPERRRR